jgi:hypothetical protein
VYVDIVEDPTFGELVEFAADTILEAYESVRRAQTFIADVDAQAFGELVATSQLLLFCAERVSAQTPMVTDRLTGYLRQQQDRV